MKLKVATEHVGLRLDVFVTRNMEGVSRSRIQRLIRSGNIAVNGAPTRSAIKVSEGMEVDVDLPPPLPAGLVAENLPLDILYEDADVAVVNKRAGMVVHPTAGCRSGTLVNAMLYRCRDLAGIGGELRPGIVHRLDKNTSGVMVVAKNERAMDLLAQQFKARTVHKEYLAVVYGVPRPAVGRIETLIGRNPRDRKKMAVLVAPLSAEDSDELDGKPALSNYRVVEVLGGFSLVRVFPETGRTHQIRVHMAHIGHPILGDSQYGGRRGRAAAHAEEQAGISARRQMLHAERLQFKHPSSGQDVTFSAPVPADMEALLQALRARAEAGNPS